MKDAEQILTEWRSGSDFEPLAEALGIAPTDIMAMMALPIQDAGKTRARMLVLYTSDTASDDPCLNRAVLTLRHFTETDVFDVESDVMLGRLSVAAPSIMEAIRVIADDALTTPPTPHAVKGGLRDVSA